MKPGIPAWSVVILVPRGMHDVLAVTRAFNVRDPALPGGDSEEGDESPAATAARELYEETGVIAKQLRCIDKWDGDRDQPVYAFLVTEWAGKRLRASSEGKPFWTGRQTLLRPTAQFHADALRVFNAAAVKLAHAV